MKKTFKKAFAVIAAAASLAFGMTTVSANAADLTTPEVPESSEGYSVTGYVSFGNNAKAGIYRDSTQINLITSCSSAYYVSVKLTSASYTTLSERSGTTYEDTDGYVSRSYTGKGITSAKGYHVADNYSTTTSR